MYLLEFVKCCLLHMRKLGILNIIIDQLVQKINNTFKEGSEKEIHTKIIFCSTLFASGLELYSDLVIAALHILTHNHTLNEVRHLTIGSCYPFMRS